MMRWKTAALGVLLLLSFSCTSRFFPSEARVRKQLLNNLPSYTAAAENWGREPAGLGFYFLSDGHYRWGNVFITVVANGYRVGGSSKDGIVVADLAAAAAQAGIDANALKQWMDTAQQLKIYSIQKMPAGYVEVQLWGADHAPYGLRYAPNEEAEQALAKEASPSKNGSGVVTRLTEHWYYFD